MESIVELGTIFESVLSLFLSLSLELGINPPPRYYLAGRSGPIFSPASYPNNGGGGYSCPASSARLAGQPASLAPVQAPQNHQFSIGFIRFRDMVNQHLIYSEKPNAFSMILEAFWRFGPIFFHLT